LGLLKSPFLLRKRGFYSAVKIGLAALIPFVLGLLKSPILLRKRGFYSAVKIGLAALIPFVLGLLKSPILLRKRAWISYADPLRFGLTQSPDFASQNWFFYYALHQKQAFERA
jgi:uncharacterized protein YqgC (DUF456 family)